MLPFIKCFKVTSLWGDFGRDSGATSVREWGDFCEKVGRLRHETTSANTLKCPYPSNGGGKRNIRLRFFFIN